MINTSLDNVNTPGVNYYQVVGTSGIRSEYVVDFNLRQQYLATDVRTASYIQTSPFNGVMQNHVVKYNGRPGQPVGVVDGKALRTAEVLLNRAEANYRNSNQTAALADLNLLKANRYTGFVNLINLTGVPLLNEILRERRLELAFEGDRFWDLKRLNLPVQRDGTKGDRADGTGVTYLFLNLPVTGSGSHKFQLPYPTLEVNFNKNLTQNPGY